MNTTQGSLCHKAWLSWGDCCPWEGRDLGTSRDQECLTGEQLCGEDPDGQQAELARAAMRADSILEQSL